MGWNSALAQYMKLTVNNKTEAENGGVDFSFRGKKPTAQKDVKNILFGEDMTKMVKSGNLEEPIANNGGILVELDVKRNNELHQFDGI